MAASPVKVAVYLVHPERLHDPALLQRYQALLTDAERRRRERFAFAAGQHEYLVTRVLVRSVLSYHCGVEPQRWRFAMNAYGRPEIATPEHARHLRFNVSHTAGLIVCLVGENLDLGIDVENTTRLAEPVELARSSFSPPEVEALLALPASQQRERFFTYWTLKEAYIKARGMGLSLPLDQFSFRVDNAPPVTISFGPEIEDVPDAWHFESYRVGSAHAMALAIRCDPSAPLELTLRELEPLQPPGSAVPDGLVVPRFRRRGAR